MDLKQIDIREVVEMGIGCGLGEFQKHLSGERPRLALLMEPAFPAPCTPDGCTRKWVKQDVLDWQLCRRTFKLPQQLKTSEVESSATSEHSRRSGRPLKIVRR